MILRRTPFSAAAAAVVVLAGLLSTQCASTASDSHSASEATADGELIGGTAAKEGQYPASIQINRGRDASGTTLLRCTGIPISRTHILLAAHCLFKFNGRVQQTFGLTMFYSYGVNAEQLVVADIKAAYLPDEAVGYLEANGTWGPGDIERAHDVAVVELETPVPQPVAVGKMSASEIRVGTPFRFGGYGCERHASTPADEAATANASDKSRLKYAQGKVTAVSPLMAQGPTYEGLAKQSLCPGDSGGPVYLDSAPADPDAAMSEFIGINNFHKSQTSGDSTNTEINFSIITTTSELGRWVNDVLAGKVKAFER